MDTETSSRSGRSDGHRVGGTADSADHRARTGHALRLGEFLDEGFLRGRVERDVATVQPSAGLGSSTAGGCEPAHRLVTHRPPVTVVAGTTVASVVAPLLYGKLAAQLNASVHTLSRAGLDHTLRSVAGLEKALERVVKPPNEEAHILIGHSQGGLAALLVGERRPDLVAGVITLGAPIHGTVRANRWLPVAAVRCMAIGSRLLDMIPPASAFKCRVINIVGDRDAIVQPIWSGFLDGAEHRCFHVGHLGLISQPQVTVFVARLVAEGRWPHRSLASAAPSVVRKAA